jgi:hypothetical protein
MRRAALAAVLVLGLSVGATACGNDNGQGAKEQDVEELQGRVSQLRLEVESLRKEVAALRSELEGASVGSVGTTATTAPPSTTTSSRA